MTRWKMKIEKHVHRTCSGGIYCADCGTVLKEKCPKCGQMERIGRKVCETDLKRAEDAKKEMDEFAKRRFFAWKRRRSLQIAPFALVFIIGSAEIPKLVPVLSRTMTSITFSMAVIGLGLLFYVTWWMDLKRFKKQGEFENEFLAEHPDLAAIIAEAEKAEEVEDGN